MLNGNLYQQYVMRCDKYWTKEYYATYLLVAENMKLKINTSYKATQKFKQEGLILNAMKKGAFKKVKLATNTEYP